MCSWFLANARARRGLGGSKAPGSRWIGPRSIARPAHRRENLGDACLGVVIEDRDERERADRRHGLHPFEQPDDRLGERAFVIVVKVRELQMYGVHGEPPRTGAANRRRTRDRAKISSEEAVLSCARHLKRRAVSSPVLEQGRARSSARLAATISRSRCLRGSRRRRAAGSWRRDRQRACRWLGAAEGAGTGVSRIHAEGRRNRQRERQRHLRRTSSAAAGASRERRTQRARGPRP
jgi:hypothetical protein